LGRPDLPEAGRTRTGRGCAIAPPFCPLCHANQSVSLTDTGDTPPSRRTFWAHLGAVAEFQEDKAHGRRGGVNVLNLGRDHLAIDHLDEAAAGCGSGAAPSIARLDRIGLRVTAARTDLLDRIALHVTPGRAGRPCRPRSSPSWGPGSHGCLRLCRLCVTRIGGVSPPVSGDTRDTPLCELIDFGEPFQDFRDVGARLPRCLSNFQFESDLRHKPMAASRDMACKACEAAARISKRPSWSL
jgi:hypothetical protein